MAEMGFYTKETQNAFHVSKTQMQVRAYSIFINIQISVWQSNRQNSLNLPLDVRIQYRYPQITLHCETKKNKYRLEQRQNGHDSSKMKTCSAFPPFHKVTNILVVPSRIILVLWSIKPSCEMTNE